MKMSLVVNANIWAETGIRINILKIIKFKLKYYYF